MGKSLVLGYGISGKAAAALLRKQGVSVAAVDRNGDGKEVFADSADFSLEGFSQVVLSPGIPQTHPLVQKAKMRGIEVIGEIELAFRYVKNACVGITGSNGKTTTTLLTTHLLKMGGRKARALGNVGESLAGYLLEADLEDILVVELSSFQLETLKTARLDAALILNITPNHLDRHSSMEEYAAAKLHIRNCLKENGKLFVSRQVFETYGIGERFDQENIALNSPEQYIKCGRENVQAAIALCDFFGVKDVEPGLETFQKPPHRLEWIAEIGGVVFYNDSKSSNIHSVMHAIAGLKGGIHLLIGGVHKGASYKPWIAAFQGKVRKLYAFGQAAEKMEEELASSFPFARAQTMEEALSIARDEAKKDETILLSPGCSSYDQFRNYEHRGDEFKRLLKENR